MKESVDKKLKERIIEVFDSYDASGAEQGWQELRKKHPKKPAKRLIFWWSSAAVFLLISGTFLLLKNTDQTNQSKISVSKNKSESISEDTISKQPDLAMKISGNDSTRLPAFQNPVINHKKSGKHGNPSLKLLNNPQKISSEKVIALNTAAHDPEPITDPGEPVSLRVHIDQPLQLKQDNIKAEIKIAEPNSFHHRQKNQTLSENEPGIRKEEIPNNKKLELSFYAGPFFNYAEGSGNTMNLGAGITSDIPLSKRFTLTAGAAIAENTLIFRDKLPINSYLAFDTNQQPNALQSGNISQISKFEAHIINLDLPVNLKYSISRDPNKVFISAGLSSFAYLKETYRYSYNSLHNSTSQFSSSRDKVINKNSGKFDMAQILNLSFGLTRTARSHDLIFEPFVKYPLGALGSQNIRFGSAGINFKLNIKPGKK